MLDPDEDAVAGGFGDNSSFYKADVNDPALANSNMTHAVFEIMSTMN